MTYLFQRHFKNSLLITILNRLPLMYAYFLFMSTSVNNVSSYIVDARTILFLNDDTSYKKSCMFSFQLNFISIAKIANLYMYIF